LIYFFFFETNAKNQELDFDLMKKMENTEFVLIPACMFEIPPLPQDVNGLG
jgi:hypothetical protein